MEGDGGYSRRRLSYVRFDFVSATGALFRQYNGNN